MSGSSKYVLDTSAFIEAKNRYYGFDLCPGYWVALIKYNEGKRLFSIDKVRDELVNNRVREPDKKPDHLSDWAKDTVPKAFFKKTEDQAVIKAFAKMVTWVNGESQFKSTAKAEFADVADGWLIAYAKVSRMIVVTLEVHRPDIQTKVPIPNVCHEFGVDCVNTFEMLEALNVQFVLRTKRHRAK